MKPINQVIVVCHIFLLFIVFAFYGTTATSNVEVLTTRSSDGTNSMQSVHPENEQKPKTPHVKRVSGAVYYGQEADNALTDLWLAELSRQSIIEVLDRSAMQTLLGELSLSGVNDDSTRQVRLGRLLGVEYFVWIQALDEQAIMEVVEAATGRGLAAIPVHYAKGHFPEMLPNLAKQAAEAVNGPLPKPSQTAPSLAFSTVLLATSNETMQATADKVIAGLTGYLINSGITVLPRRFAAETVRERWRQEKGLVGDTANEHKFLGADYVLSISINISQLEIVMVETSTGRRVGKKKMSMEELQTEKGVDALDQWVMGRLKPLLVGPSILPPFAITNAHYAATESLKSLYTGIMVHNEGRYLDAISNFEDSLSRKFISDETVAWLGSCYRLAGFPEIGGPMESYASTSDYIPERTSLVSQAEPGMALLGVTAAEGIPDGMAERTAILLIDSLHEASGSTVLVAEDIAGLRDEYDLLLGLDNIKGTTWRQASPILVKQAVTAHLESGDTGLQLRLCMVRDCNPFSICDVVVSLPANNMQWQPLLIKAARELLAHVEQPGISWSPPRLKFKENQQHLLEQLEKSFSPTVYLKALTQYPNLLQYRRQVPWRLELDRWFLRVLPKENPARPMLEFEVASLPIDGLAFSKVMVLQQSHPNFLKIAEKYPDQIIGLFSRYNVALLDMTRTNYADTQVKINRLIPELARFEQEETLPAIKSIHNMNSALKFALGLPGGTPVDVFYQVGIITAANQNKGDSLYSVRTHWYSSLRTYWFGLPRGNFFKPRSADQMRVDLDALCFLRDQGWFPMRFMREIVDQNGTGSEFTQYAVLKYFCVMDEPESWISDEEIAATTWIGVLNAGNNQPANSLMEGVCILDKKWPVENLSIIYQAVPDILKKVLDREPKLITKNEAEQVLPNTRQLPDDPIVNNARQRAREIIDAAFTRPPDDQSQASLADPWKLGPFKDPHWEQFMMPHGLLVDVMQVYYPHLTRLHELYDNEVKSRPICRLYCQFGLAFFQTGHYELAEPLLEQVKEWRDYRSRPPDPQSYAMALYLLALVKQSNRDIPSALSLARELESYIDSQPKTDFPFFNKIKPRGFGGFSSPNLKTRVSILIKQLRENPELPFYNPYGPP